MSDASHSRNSDRSTPQPAFESGEVVADCEDTDESLAKVVDPDAGRADKIAVSGEKTVADVNPGYSDSERVVTIAFYSDLAALPATWDGTVAEKIERFANEWGVQVRTYNYPESRLQPQSGRGENK